MAVDLVGNEAYGMESAGSRRTMAEEKANYEYESVEVGDKMDYEVMEDIADSSASYEIVGRAWNGRNGAMGAVGVRMVSNEAYGTALRQNAAEGKDEDAYEFIGL